ncbi:MAG: hypothetical protein ACI37S_01425 [Candidatus Gastranaerophilaceae bacterium]
MIKLFLIVISLIFMQPVLAFEYGYTSSGFKHVKHKHPEHSYQHAWCSTHKGIEEYQNKDYTRVDCLTSTHAVEFDFANKWAESIGQALHYQYMTGKKGKVVLILENPEKEMVYFKRIKKLASLHNFDVEYITPEILNIKDDCYPY